MSLSPTTIRTILGLLGSGDLFFVGVMPQVAEQMFHDIFKTVLPLGVGQKSHLEIAFLSVYKWMIGLHGVMRLFAAYNLTENDDANSRSAARLGVASLLMETLMFTSMRRMIPLSDKALRLPTYVPLLISFLIVMRRRDRSAWGKSEYIQLF